jgi:acyl-CoA synthetase (NDP forming)
MQRRPVYTHAELRRLIDPQSVAIVGLSRNEASFGARTAANLTHFQGRTYGVNPKADNLYGIRCFASIEALPEAPDCAVLAIPVDAVETTIEACAAAGVGGCVIYASGFAETGLRERIALQDRLGAIARASGMRIAGPNCLGLINNVTRAGLSFTSGYADPPRTGRIAIVSQSGGLGQSISQVAQRGGAWSHLMAAGNSCDVDVCDYVSYLADDPSCTVVACIAEGLRDGERLIEAGERAMAANKPIVMYKIATGSSGAKAAMSHTGTLAGSNAAFEAAYRRLGIVKVDNIEDVYETANFLGKAGRPKAAGVAAVGASGGACIITLDKAEQFGVAMPLPAPATRAILEANIPDFGNPTNPCDITAQVATNPASYAACAEALLTDPSYGALVVMMPSIIPERTQRNVAMFSKLAEGAGKPVCLSWMSEWKDGPGAVEAEADGHVARFRSTERAFATLAAWNERETALRRAPARRRDDPANVAAPEVARFLDSAGPKLTEREAKQILAAYGVPVAADHVVQNVEAAVAAAQTIGVPVVLKVESPDIPHKTEAGVVRLNLADESMVRAAYAEIIAAAKRVEPAPRITGVLVQPMIAAGVEIVVGAQRDPTFGPLVVVGLGGIMVELLRDATAELAPVDHAMAIDMIGRLKGVKLLTGFRGSEPVDVDALARIIVAVSELAVDHAESISEIDVNPIICSPGRAIAVDALIIRPGLRH